MGGTTALKVVKGNDSFSERMDVNMKRKLYIAYGSNMDTRQMALRCPTAKLIGSSEVEGYRLLFRGSKTGTYATIEKAEGYKVPIIIWEIGETDEINLDRYEGFPSFYYKKELTISVDGKRRKAIVYIMDESRPLGEPNYGYYEVIEEAYTKFHFDMDILEKALEDTIARGNTMDKKLTPELKLYKEEFDFLHKKIGELEWEIATIFYGRKAVTRSEIEILEDRLENYRANIGMLVEKIRDEVTPPVF